MNDTASSIALLRLLSWLSPAFPVGAFAYSHGLEQAIQEEVIRSRVDLVEWLGPLLESGSCWNDAVLLAEAWRRAGSGLDCAEIAELAEALAGSRERHMETALQGAAFSEAVAAWGLPQQTFPYPIAVGSAAASHGVALEAALTAYLHAFVSNLVQAAVRLVPLGQRDGVAAIATLEPAIAATAKRAATSMLDDLGSCTIVSEIMSMRHETLYSRVFRS